MRIEVNSAADFVMNLLRVKKANPQLSEGQLQHFKGSLEQILTRHFARHWYPDVPTKGSGFRCLRINGKMDPIIERAGHAAGLNTVALRKMLPLELTIWIDPEEVSYRIGENGTICVLYDQQQSRASPSSDLDSTGSSSCDEFIMERVGRVDLSTISSDSGTSVMVDFMESNPSNSLVTQGSKHNKYNNSNNHHNNHHYAKRHNNSVSSSSSGQTSPPLSPPFNGYNNNYNNNRYQQHNNQHTNYYSPSVHQQQQQQQYFHWDNQFVNNKVRTQC